MRFNTIRLFHGFGEMALFLILGSTFFKCKQTFNELGFNHVQLITIESKK